MYLSCLYLNPRNSKARRDLGNCHEMHRTIMNAFSGQHSESCRENLQVLYYLDASKRDIFPKLLVQSKEKPNWSHLKPGYTVNFTNTNPSDENPGVAVKEVDYSTFKFASGQKFHFRLKANVTKKVGTTTKKERLAGKKSNGRRMPLYKEEDQIKWLIRKAESGGFKIQEVQLKKDLYHPNRFSVEQVLSHFSSSKNGVENGADSGLDLSKINVVGIPEGKFAGYKVLNDETKDEKLNKKSKAKRIKLTFFSVIFDGILVVTDPETFIQTLINGIGPAKAYGFGLLMLS